MENPKDYRIRMYLPSDHEQAMPHLLDVRPRRMAIPYKELATESQTEMVEYYGLWVQKNVYRTVRPVDGKPTFIDKITKGNYSYVWDDKGLPTIQTLSVYNCYRDGSFDPKFEVYPHHLVTPKEQYSILTKRRSQVKDNMTSRAIALGIGKYSIPFFKKYSRLMETYIESGDTELIDVLKAIEPKALDDLDQQNWIFTTVPDSARILAGLSPEQKEFIEVADDAQDLNIKQVLVLNFWMGTLIPSARAIASYHEAIAN